jgi:hypothetical protein
MEKEILLMVKKSEKEKDHLYYLKNRKRILEQGKRYHQTEGYKLNQKEYQKTPQYKNYWNKLNRTPKRRKYMRKFYLDHEEEIKARKKLWQQNNYTKQPIKERFCIICKSSFTTRIKNKDCCSPNCNREKLLIYWNDYHEKNKDKISEKKRTIWKATRKEYMRSPEFQAYKRIREKTNHHFPLYKCLKCKFCDNGATEHHHYTNPIKFDKFHYVCHSCHNKLHGRRNWKQ